MAEVHPPKRCRLFKPGHHPHWIHARHSAEDTEHPRLAGRLLDATPEGLIVIEVNDQILRMWNHDPLRLIEAAGISGGRIRYQASQRLLFAGGGYMFYVAVPPNEHEPCREPD